MHELSIAQALVEAVAESLALDDTPTRSRIRRVRLRVGALSGVAAEALEFCFGVAARGTILEGALLEIERVAVAVRCDACGLDAELPEFPPLCCPACGGPPAAILRGKELEVESIEVEEEEEGPPWPRPPGSSSSARGC